jgi:hypothetical protein
MDLPKNIKTKFARLAVATDKVADRIKAGKLNPGRGECIKDNGRPCCAFGHVLAAARMNPMEYKAGNPSALLSGINKSEFDREYEPFDLGLDDQVLDNLSEVNDSKDYDNKAERNKAIIRALKDVKKEFLRFTK